MLISPISSLWCITALVQDTFMQSVEKGTPLLLKSQGFINPTLQSVLLCRCHNYILNDYMQNIYHKNIHICVLHIIWLMLEDIVKCVCVNMQQKQKHIATETHAYMQRQQRLDFVHKTRFICFLVYLSTFHSIYMYVCNVILHILVCMYAYAFCWF